MNLAKATRNTTLSSEVGASVRDMGCAAVSQDSVQGSSTPSNPVSNGSVHSGLEGCGVATDVAGDYEEASSQDMENEEDCEQAVPASVTVPISDN
ncbi:hypothetical protein V6N11_020519 [Hibiscus sabdariffa]|uniref:Uncharacterized protein n=1 Tax=Hibiscus sabdariffa TaxID=183260 RepID=A0ABR2Q8M6_9ROSI